jgi:replicative DNA helicase
VIEISVEPLVIAKLVEAENPRAAFTAGVTKNDFDIYTDEFSWIVSRYERSKPINRRSFCARFPDFEFVVSREKLEDLIEELKNERAYSAVASLVESVSENLLPENAVEQAEHMREVLSEVVKAFSVNSEISLKNTSDHLEQVRQHRILASKGQTVGMPFLIPSLDYHYDGCCRGRMISFIGRPGDGKSYFLAWLAWVTMKMGFNTAIFSPEMNEHEHLCRIHTLASADPVVQKACDLKSSFSNRALMRGRGFDMKAYKRLCEYMENLDGNCYLFTKKYRRDRLTTQYIGSRVEDLDLYGIFVDPISKIYAGTKRNENAVWESYDKVHAYQELIEEHNIFGIATNWSTRQLGRSKVERAPSLDDSFGSDALAQESDHVIGLLYDEDDHTLTLRCTKSRFGKGKFSVTMNFDPDSGLFTEMNIPYDVALQRASLNGSALPNGNEGVTRVKSRRKILRKATKEKVVV